MMPVWKFVTSCRFLAKIMRLCEELQQRLLDCTEKVDERHFMWTYRSIQAQQFTGRDFSDCGHDCSRSRSVHFSKTFRPLLNIQSLPARNYIYHATLAVTRGLGFYGLPQRISPFTGSHLLQPAKESKDQF